MITKLLLLYFIPWLILVFATYFIMEKPTNLYNLLFDPDPYEHAGRKDDSYYCCYYKWIPVANIVFTIIYTLLFTFFCVAPFFKKYLSRITIFFKKYLSRITIK